MAVYLENDTQCGLISEFILIFPNLYEVTLLELASETSSFYNVEF